MSKTFAYNRDMVCKATALLALKHGIYDPTVDERVVLDEFWWMHELMVNYADEQSFDVFGSDPLDEFEVAVIAFDHDVVMYNSRWSYLDFSDEHMMQIITYQEGGFDFIFKFDEKVWLDFLMEVLQTYTFGRDQE